MKKAIQLDQDFLKKVLALTIPMIMQQLVETFVGLADSMMVSEYSQLGVSAVQVASQWEWVSSSLSFGICSGVGIYVAQFFGSKDYVNLRKSFGLMLILSLIVATPFTLAAIFFPKVICGFYISDLAVIDEASKYLVITALSYVFVMISFTYNYTYRCIGKTKVTMVVSSFVVLLNCFINYLLIFGHFGLPKMGVAGAAMGTLISRAIGSFIFYLYSKQTHQVFIGKPKEMFHIQISTYMPLFRRIFPTVANEGFFGLGQSLFVKAFGMLGAGAVASVAIADRISNIFFMVIWAIVSAVQAMIGAELGKNDTEQAQIYARKFLKLSFYTTIALGIGLLITAFPLVNLLYHNESSTVKTAAAYILMAYALKICLRLFNAVIFGFLRAGGDTKYLAFLDSGILYLVGIPLAFICVGVLHLDIISTILIVQLEQAVRIFLAFRRYQAGYWLSNITGDLATS